MKRMLIWATSLFASFTIGVTSAYAQDWPSSPVRMIVPYGAGGSLDVIARILAHSVARNLGVSVVVENAPGADGTLGVRRTIHARPDGYTFLVAINSNVTLPPLLNPTADFQVSDLVGVAKVGTSGIVLAGRPDLEASTLPELAALSKTMKGGLSFGTPGVSSFQYLSMLEVSAKAGIDTLHVPYNAAAQIASDVMGGHLDMIVAGLPSLVPLIRKGQLKAFTVMSQERDIGESSIPGLSETQGLEELDFSLWTGVFAPKGTPSDIIEAMNKAISAVLTEPDVIEKFRLVGVKVTAPMTPVAFTKFVENDAKYMTSIVQQAGMSPQN